MAVFHGLSGGKIAHPCTTAPGPATPPGTPPTVPASPVEAPLDELPPLEPLDEPPPSSSLCEPAWLLLEHPAEAATTTSAPHPSAPTRTVCLHDSMRQPP